MSHGQLFAEVRISIFLKNLLINYIPYEPGITESTTLSLRTAKIIRGHARIRQNSVSQNFKNPMESHLSVADSMIIYHESQLDFKNKSPVESVRQLDGTSDYKKLFRSKKYVLMFLCDTIGFFSYIIIFQVIYFGKKIDIF